VQVNAPEPLTLGAMHIPNSVTGRKAGYLDAVERIVRGWRRGPALLIGDTNSGRPEIDEESPVFGPRYTTWFDHFGTCGWADAFRHLHGDSRVFTWYSPNRGNGFRLDQAFVNRHLLPCLRQVGYEWGQPPNALPETNRTFLSDHAALILDFAELDQPALGVRSR
jgi:exonuclease III